MALVLSFVLTIGSISGAFWLANDKIDSARTARIDDSALKETKKGEPANFLIIGSDTRAFVDSAADEQHFGDAQGQSGQRSDTIMVAHVDPSTGTGMLVSFPRDLWVDIPGAGKSRINAAFNIGPQRVIETIKQDFDVDINHYLEVNFAGFRDIVSALGSVPLFFPAPARDKKTGLNVPEAGCQNLDGEQALAYVRSRFYEYLDKGRWKSDPTSDLGRIQRQQYFLRSIAKEATSVKNPFQLNKILNRTVANLVKDPKLGFSDLRTLVNVFKNVDPRAIEMYTMPAHPANVGGASVLIVDDAQAAPILEKLRTFGKAAPSGSPGVGTVAPASVRVSVLNGSGVSGRGALVLGALRDQGFAVIDPAQNAERSNYAETEVRYGPGAQGAAKAAAVRAYLGGVGKVVATDSAAGADVVLVVGRDFTRVSAPSAAPITTSPPTSAVTTPPTTAPPANLGGAMPGAGC